jgi:uncharacterized repeat protein (TIGR04042 family)
MPEVHFRVRWPDDQVEVCYSPSTVIKQVLAAGETYGLADFLARSEDGLTRASERVREVHGFPCSNAAAQLGRIRRTAATFADRPEARVTVEAFDG